MRPRGAQSHRVGHQLRGHGAVVRAWQVGDRPGEGERETMGGIRRVRVHGLAQGVRLKGTNYSFCTNIENSQCPQSINQNKLLTSKPFFARYYPNQNSCFRFCRTFPETSTTCLQRSGGTCLRPTRCSTSRRSGRCAASTRASSDSASSPSTSSRYSRPAGPVLLPRYSHHRGSHTLQVLM